MSGVEKELAELQDKLESILPRVDRSMHIEVQNKFASLKRMIKSNISMECRCEHTNKTPDGEQWLVRYDCPVHKGKFTEPTLCPCYMEDYTCAWFPGKMTCPDTPCSNPGSDSRGITLRTRTGRYSER